jgi:hypothetical protein
MSHKPTDQGEKNHSRLRLVSGCEYRMASIRIGFTLVSSASESPKNEGASPGAGS